MQLDCLFSLPLIVIYLNFRSFECDLVSGKINFLDLKIKRICNVQLSGCYKNADEGHDETNFLISFSELLESDVLKIRSRAISKQL